mmetsp:Transcript_125298/g.350873  ORF Transcript_125298/g.350873 Transcript_125298/m.350873 type:complete len:695 (+) Transcript_125298:126-2210(+)
MPQNGSASARLGRCIRGNRIEFKDIDLRRQTERIFPGRRYHDLSFRDQVEVLRCALLPDNNLIDPHSTAMKWWDLLIVCCLVFVGIVTPYEVIFIGPLKWTNWLFMCNRFVDTVFVIDIVLQFFLKVDICNDGRRGRLLLKDPKIIRWRYLTSWFIVDIVGVMQFDLLFMFYEDSEAVAGIKFLRMVRLFRLMKLLRILRGSRVMARWQDYFTISFAVQKLIKFTCGLLISSHWMACFWGLVGLALGRELCDEEGKPLEIDGDIAPHEVSWVTVLFLGGKTTPDNPCSPWHVYTAALHWAVMTITSIGYGDIVPVRNEEYLACVVCMLLGGVLWANIIGGTCAVLAKGDPVQDNFETNTDLLNVMMTECGMPRSSQASYREYLREAKVYDTVGHFRQLAQQFSPALKGKLLLQVSRQWVEKVPYLRMAGERCLMHLVDDLEVRFFSRREVLDITSDWLCINDRGTVARGGKVITPGGVFHVDFIVENPNLRRLEETVSLTYSLIMILHRDKFFEVIEGQPELKEEVKKASLFFALSRCVHLCMQVYKREHGISGPEPWSFVDAFDRLHIAQVRYQYATRGQTSVQALPAVEMVRSLDETVGQADFQKSPPPPSVTLSVPGKATDGSPARAKAEPPPATAAKGGHCSSVAGRLDALEVTLTAAFEEIQRLRDAVPSEDEEEIEVPCRSLCCKPQG